MLKKKLEKSLKVQQLDLKTVNKRQPLWKILLLMSPAIIVILVFTIIPFLAAVTDAFQASKSISEPTERVASLHQFELIFKDPAFSNSLYNSFVYAIISIPIVMLISIVISAAISNVLRKRLRGFWQTIFFLPYVTSAVAIGLAFSFLFDADTGLLNKITGHKVPWLKDPNGHSALGAMLIYGVWRGIAFNVLIFTSAMLGVDKTQYKAASIDGAGPIEQFFKITLPSIRKTTSFLLTVGIIGAIKVFPLSLFKNNPQEALDNNGSTLMLYIFAKISIGHNYMLAGAASLLLVVISIVFSSFIRSSIDLIIIGIRKIKEVNLENKIKNDSFIQQMKK